MDIQSLLLVLSIHALALISPGPDFAVITRISVVHDRSSGVLTAFGVALAISVYVTLCSLGLSVVLLAIPFLSQFLTYAGVLYLIWLGTGCLRSKGKIVQRMVESDKKRAFVTGFVTNILNPKAMFYFASILPQVLKPHASITETITIIFLLFLESFLWFSSVAFLFSSNEVLTWLTGRLIWFERGIGIVLIVLALHIAMRAG